MTGRIRWHDTETGNLIGYAGSVGDWLFRAFPTSDGDSWCLFTQFPGTIGENRSCPGLDKVKAEAEHWLEEFVSSLGAIFPAPAFEFDGDDGEPLEVRYAPGRRVRFAHPDYGYPGEADHAAAHLILGEVYTIDGADIGQSKTNLLLQGIPNELFNSVFFEPADDEEASQ